ncbi:MAG TPA: mechanosensitive ion channel family protein [Acidobacteriota bacterium]|nr:mechanosensitive ion channel family protein [Acidobacteriota bacterium]
MFGLSWEQCGELAVTYGTSIALALGHIILIAVGGWIALRIIRRSLLKLEEVLTRHADSEDQIGSVATQKRVRTLAGLLRTLASIVVWAIVVITSLTELGVDIGPILAGAGIAGLAVGFGAQNLVRDIISGFFFIMENQVRVGDVAVINGTGGLVEAITFRTITLRDLSGVVHIFPHGQVSTLSNMTMKWSAYVIDVGVAYREDTDAVVDVMKEVHAGMMAEPEWCSMILQEIEVLGVDDFGESEVTIKARMKTVPLQQWSVGREYRRRLKYAFDEKGIEIPFPQCTLHAPEAIGAHIIRQASDPAPAKVA